MTDSFLFNPLTFPSDGSVLNGVDISMGVSESVVLFGPNGGGKSSVMRVIAGTAPRTVPRGESVYLPQTPYMFRGTVKHNLLLSLDSSEVKEALELASELEVDHLLEKPSAGISVGEAQRICIARTLASHAPLVMLDEPLAPINAASRKKIGRIIDLRTAGRGLLLASHSIGIAKMLADRLIILDGGVVLQEGPVEDVLADPVNRRVAEILGV